MKWKLSHTSYLEEIVFELRSSFQLKKSSKLERKWLSSIFWVKQNNDKPSLN